MLIKHNNERYYENNLLNRDNARNLLKLLNI